MNIRQITKKVSEINAQKITRKVSRIFQHMDDCLSGEESGLENVWDEICVQVQFEESIYWDSYIAEIDRQTYWLVKELKDFELAAMWLQTDDGEDQSFDTDFDDFCPEIDPVVNYLRNEYILVEASNWTNEDIRKYLERSYE